MSNLWKQFSALLPSDPLLIATVISHNSDGTSTLQHPGGGQSTARGTSVAIGSKAFIRSNQIQGAAPDLPLIELEV
ncbi:MAG: hypothetical protein RBR03_09145 [Desulfuromonas thiophila]|nr:hypothetical protein [Desulfuromonas thiophila]MDY0398811.1 hypothetical protein [Desulfuromonas thiophila]